MLTDGHYQLFPLYDGWQPPKMTIFQTEQRFIIVFQTGQHLKMGGCQLHHTQWNCRTWTMVCLRYEGTSCSRSCSHSRAAFQVQCISLDSHAIINHPVHIPSLNATWYKSRFSQLMIKYSIAWDEKGLAFMNSRLICMAREFGVHVLHDILIPRKDTTKHTK